jgi:hypothetical protein
MNIYCTNKVFQLKNTRPTFITVSANSLQMYVLQIAIDKYSVLVIELGRDSSEWKKQQSLCLLPICCKSMTNFITKCCIEYTSPWTGFKLTTLVTIGTDCTGSCKSNYHTITTRTAPIADLKSKTNTKRQKQIVLHFIL